MIKRFIAGAVCPQCGGEDCIRAYNDEARFMLVRECVDCGFEDELSTQVNQPNELKTRVNEVVDAQAEVKAEPIIFKP